MMSTLSPTAGDLDDESWYRLSDVLDEFERLWQQHTNSPPGIAAMQLPPRGDPLRGRMLIELIKIDQEYRWCSGERRELAAYLGDWPELHSSTAVMRELLEAEIVTRFAYEDPTPSVTQIRKEVESRFSCEVWQSIDIGGLATQAEAEANPGPLLVGETFAGRYTICEELGRGGMGVVYRAKDEQLKRPVAIKIPRFDRLGILKRFEREARTMAQVNHRNVCPIYDVNVYDSLSYLVMDLIEGQALADRMQGGRFEVSEAARIVEQLANALNAVHEKGVIHRDVKPANIIMDKSGEPFLTDFGLASQIVEASDVPRGVAPHAVDGSIMETSRWSGLTHPVSLLGTPAYMSPEQIRGEAATPQSDIFSLGVILYEMLTGIRPFVGSSLNEIREKILHAEVRRPREISLDVPEQLETICLKAMARSLADRYESATAMGEALADYLRPAAPPFWHRRRHTLFAAAAAIPILLAAVTIYFTTGKGTLELVVSDPNAIVTIDGERIQLAAARRTPVELHLGTHRLQAVRDGNAHFEGTFSLRWRGQRTRFTVPHFMDVKQFMKQILTPFPPGGFCSSPGGRTLYVGYGPESVESPIEIYDVSGGKLKQAISFSSGVVDPTHNRHDHKGLVVSADGRFLFATDYYHPYVTRIDLRQNNACKNVAIASRWAIDAGVAPDNRRLVIPSGTDGRPTDENNDRITVVDTTNESFSPLGDVELQDEPSGYGVGFSADSQFAYLVTRPRKSDVPTLYEIRLAPKVEVHRLLPLLGSDVRDLAVSNRHNRIFVNDARRHTIQAIDMRTFQVVSQIDIQGRVAKSLAINAQGNVLAAVCPRTRDLVLLDPDDGTILAWSSGLPEFVSSARFAARSGPLFLAVTRPNPGIAVVQWERMINRMSIVFASNRAGESYQIYVMGADGLNVSRLTNNHSTDCCPRWSPDGRKIAFVSDRAGPLRICVMDYRSGEVNVMDETDPRSTAPDDVPLAWSPSGESVVFTADEGRAIRVVDVATGHVRTLIDGKIVLNKTGRSHDYYGHQNVACNGQDGSILFDSQAPDWAYNRDVLRLDPRTLKFEQITDSWGENSFFFGFVPSPDGTKSVAVEISDAPAPGRQRIVLLNADGGILKCLAQRDAGSFPATPSWFPNGRRIVYSAKGRNYRNIYSVDVDGGKARQLTTGDWDDIQPDVTGRPHPRTTVAE